MDPAGSVSVRAEIDLSAFGHDFFSRVMGGWSNLPDWSFWGRHGELTTSFQTKTGLADIPMATNFDCASSHGWSVG